MALAVISSIIGFIIAIISVGFTFAGIRYFAHLLRIQPWALSPRILLPLLVMITVVIWVVPPSTPIAVSEILFHSQVTPMTAYSLIIFFLGIAIWQIRQAAGVRYRKALAWFAAYLLLMGIAVAVSTLSEFTGLNPLFQQGIFLLHIVSALTLVNAGISFNKITRQTEKFQLTNSSAIDLLTYTASYASNPKDIDIILDDMRTITATNNTKYSPEDMRKLVRVYQRLEAYLTTEEPLRIFTKDSLRTTLKERFDARLVSIFLEEPPIK